MPHKHKRKRDEDTSNFDLAPTTRAKPLSAYTKASLFSKDDNDTTSNKRRKLNNIKPKKTQDDTPRAFARLMAWQATGKRPSGLDNGTTTKASKKQQRKQPDQTNTSTSQPNLKTSESTPTPSTLTPKILPGETLSNFALRVDQSLPLSNISRSTNANLPADIQAKLKKAQRTTKHNKRLQRMQADWRTTESKLRDKEADEADELEDQKEEDDLLWAGVRSAGQAKKGKKKRGAKDEDDPWKDLEKKRREETRQKSLQDVVTAPPVLKKMKSKLKTRDEDFEALDGKEMNGEEDVLVDVSNVPGKVGSLRRREELNATRKAVIEGYRKLHGKKRRIGEPLDMSRAIMT